MNTMSIPPRSFHLSDEIPDGTTVLEASAGTGKTYAIVGIAAQMVADGMPLSELLLMTFSRAATQELRSRLRARIGYLRTTEYAANELVRDRLDAALANFDHAVVATTHSFCQKTLAALGIAGDYDPDATLVEDVNDIAEEVIGDLYLRMYASADRPAMSVTDAREVGRQAVFQRSAILEPENAEPDSVPDHRYRLARAVRKEVDRRKRQRAIRDFDDLQELLRETLRDPDVGEHAAQQIRSQFSVVMVDEFQDTDPVQWEILRRVFHGHTRLILVGDPKQAIYAFRGAEVLCYLDAVRQADQRLILDTNRRTDDALLHAVDRLFDGAALGNENIVVHPVSGVHPEQRLSQGPALRLRYLTRQGPWEINKSGVAPVTAIRPAIASDVAADIRRTLASGQTINIQEVSRAVRPGDIAVLVRMQKTAELVHEELRRLRIPSVLASGTSVFDTDAAHEWLALLDAVESPQRSDRVRRAALGPLMGERTEDLDRQGSKRVAELSSQIRRWAAQCHDGGFAAMFEQIAHETDLDTRLLATSTGERMLTDLRHIAQLANHAMAQESLGLAALRRWLHERIAHPTIGTQTDQSRRLDSDANAVQIMTVHASKGLEFPIVYLPFIWDASRRSDREILLLHNDSGERILNVGGSQGPGFADSAQRHQDEDLAEELRLAYVAVTRAQCRVVLWWAPTVSTRDGALHRLLFGREFGRLEPRRGVDIPSDRDLADRFGRFAAAAGDNVVVEQVDVSAATAEPLPSANDVGVALEAARFARTIDHQWRRTSYSALVAGAHHAGVSSEPEVAQTTDESDTPSDDAEIAPVPQSPASPMNSLPYGAAFGTLVHEILERIDTDAEDLTAEVAAQCVRAVGVGNADLDVAVLADAITGVMTTPLPGFDGTTLASVPNRDRLPELDFELPLAGGVSPTQQRATLADVADAFDQFLPDDDPLAEYSDALRHTGAAPLVGYLTGSIDAVLRIDGRYVVVDYKTNRLAHGELTVAHYHHDAMAAEMIRSHYPLQALLYLVALHRYLRWRLPDYHPQTHLAGAQYHFVRAMIGPQTPPEHGVFTWSPPAELVVATSDLLTGLPQ